MGHSRLDMVLPISLAETTMDVQASSLIIAVVALIVSTWAGWSSRHTAKEQNRIQARLLSLESVRERDRQSYIRRASLRAQIVREPEQYVFIVRNEGNGQARAIQVLIDGKQISDHGTILDLGSQTVHTLGPGAEAKYLAAITFGSPLVYNVDLSWEDDTGAPGHWQSQITI